MTDIKLLQFEAEKLRKLIECCNPKQTELVADNFPIAHCKGASMLLSYHYLSLWPSLKIKGMGGRAKGHPHITHYWLEIDDIVIDITGDQYNLMENHELNRKIIKCRPFPPVHVEYKSSSYLYKLFDLDYEEEFIKGYPSIWDDFVEKMKRAHDKLMSLESCT